jgi:hypothetical protein
MPRDELFTDDPARLALREAYLAILAWPIRKQTTSPGDLGGLAGEAAGPLTSEEDHDKFYPQIDE